MRKMKRVTVLRAQVIPNITKYHRSFLNIPEEHQSLGFLSTDCEEIMYLALDDATKKANVSVAYADNAHAGLANPEAHVRGTIIGMLSGPKVQDVKSGMRYAKDFIEYHSRCYFFDENEDKYCYVHLIPRAGEYYKSKYQIPEDSAVAHLTAAPVEATYALDHALKSSDTKIAHFYEIPTKTNTGGAILYGTESACKSAVEAFLNAVEYCYDHPLKMD